MGLAMRRSPISVSLAGMEQRQTLHFIDGSTRSRAELSRTIYGLGHHAEVYADLDEFLERPPVRGIVLVRDEGGGCGVETVLAALSDLGLWLPVVAVKHDPSPEDIVEAMRAGALDYLRLPLSEGQLCTMLSRVSVEAEMHGRARRRMIEAQGRIGTLSKREREVLEWLSEGSSNKIIARELEISPRTVEIHRANMMNKLGARHSAEAIRMNIEAHIGR